VDSHLHADILQHVSPEDFFLYEQGGAGISWSYVHEPKTWGEYPAYFDSLEALARSTTEQRFPLFYLVGVHPRSMPPEHTVPGLDPFFWSSLARHVTEPFCLGLGELGLETGSPRETAILKEQLIWAASFLPLDKRVGIHTPRTDKARMTAVILDLLEEVPALRPRIVIDHVCNENVQMVMDSGLMMGMTMQEGKMTAKKLTEILGKFPALEDRIMINSDSAMKTASEYRRFADGGDQLEISGDLHTKLVRDNACAFWGIEL
jgi:predicted metal-dependent TIM-barrel fold hydrolase